MPVERKDLHRYITLPHPQNLLLPIGVSGVWLIIGDQEEYEILCSKIKYLNLFLICLFVIRNRLKISFKYKTGA